MADKFCIYCGSPLAGEDKFCTNCGRPAVEEVGEKGPFPALDGQRFDRLAAKIRMPTLAPSLPSMTLPELAASTLSKPRAASSGLIRSEAAGAADLDPIVFDRIYEPNEYAFTVLVPRGWQIRGGMFSVNPIQVDGPNNSISPKCDFAVMSDDRGTIMLRWLPSWNYADPTFSPAGGAFCQPGQWYQGMPVRLMVSAKQFLCEMLQAERPRATNMTIVAENPLDDVTAAYYRRSEPVNQNLRQTGQAPMKFESRLVAVHYSEDGQPCWEEIETTICDHRAGRFMWWNDNTFMMRATAPAFAKWGRVLLEIRNSLEMNPQWLAAVEKGRSERSRMVWDTQQFVNQVNDEIIKSRQKVWEEMERMREQAEARRRQEEEARRKQEEEARRKRGERGDAPKKVF